MERVRTQREREAIGAVWNNLPKSILDRLGGVGIISNIPAWYIGLHPYRDTTDGRSYDNTSHVVFEVHQELPRSQRQSTIMLLDNDAFDPLVILHEIGHALDERLGLVSFDLSMRPLTNYAKTNCLEAFATGFQAWLTHEPTGRISYPTNDYLRAHDPELAHFFDTL
jgi:hypothetical protein